MGGENILQSVAAAAGKPVAGTELTDTPAKQKHEPEELSRKLVQDGPRLGGLHMAKVRDRFLSLHVDRDSVSWYGNGSDLDSDSITFQQVAASLPPPPAWDPLVKRLQQRTTNKELLSSTLVLKAMAHWLQGDIHEAINDLDSLQKQPASCVMDQPYAISAVQFGLIQGSDNGEEVLTVLKQRVQTDAGAGYASSLQLPDLVTLVGEAKATDFLRDALRSEKAQISVRGGEATGKLARKLALGMVAELPVAQWSLAQTL